MFTPSDVVSPAAGTPAVPEDVNDILDNVAEVLIVTGNLTVDVGI